VGWVQVDVLLARVEEAREARLGPVVRRVGEGRMLEAVAARGEARQDQGRGVAAGRRQAEEPALKRPRTARA
jgi:hypothetical protein